MINHILLISIGSVPLILMGWTIAVVAWLIHITAKEMSVRNVPREPSLGKPGTGAIAQIGKLQQDLPKEV